MQPFGWTVSLSSCQNSLISKRWYLHIPMDAMRWTTQVSRWLSASSVRPVAVAPRGLVHCKVIRAGRAVSHGFGDTVSVAKAHETCQSIPSVLQTLLTQFVAWFSRLSYQCCGTPRDEKWSLACGPIMDSLVTSSPWFLGDPIKEATSFRLHV